MICKVWRTVVGTWRGDVVSGRIVAELGVLAEGEGAFGEVLKAFRGVLEDLDRNLSAGLAAWDGEARAAYQHAHGVWRAAADDMAGRLAGLEKVIGVGHRNYRRSLAVNVTMWHGA